LCFKHQNTPSESNDSEFKEDKLSQDSVKFKGDEPKDLKKKDWLTALHTVLFSLCILMFHGYYNSWYDKLGSYSFAMSLSIRLLL